MNKFIKTMLTIFTVSAMVGASTITASAATDVKIDVQATTLNMTIPATAPIIFNPDGTNTVPTNFDIKNNSLISGVHLASVALDAQTSGWKLLDASQDTKTLKANDKNIKFSVGKVGSLKLVKPTTGTMDTKGSYTFAPSDIVIPASGTQKLDFQVERGAFTSAIASANAFSMTLNFDFN